MEEVIANNDFFRFCFVEKNRIDDFSRIASFTPNHQERLISSLFGIHEFNSFVGHFNEGIDSYLPYDSTAAGELQELDTSLASDREIVNAKAGTLKALADEEKLLANSYQEGMEYHTFVQLIGTPENGAIKDLADQLSRPLRQKVGAIKMGLDDALASVRVSWRARSALQEARLARANELSYRSLYESVLALETIDPENCPSSATLH